jgi:hypothetical protein
MPSKVRPPKTREQKDQRNLRSRQRRKRAVAVVVVEGQRTCAHPGCTTILSRFNTRDICAPHERLTARSSSPSLFNCDF